MTTLPILFAVAVCQAQESNFAPDLNFQEIHQSIIAREQVGTFGQEAASYAPRIKVIYSIPGFLRLFHGRKSGKPKSS